MTPAAARLLLEQFERSGIGAQEWPAAVRLRRILLECAAGEGNAGEFEQQFRALCELRARCRREGWCSGNARRALWRDVQSDLREGCLRLSASGHAPSAPLLVRALRTALEDAPSKHEAARLLPAATTQVILAGAARRARRLLRVIERDLCSPVPVLAAGPEGINQCLDSSARLAARFGPQAPRTALVAVLASGWLMRASAARAVEAIDRFLGAPGGGTRAERDAHCLAVAIASCAWDELGDARESLRLLGLARTLARRGFVQRWGACAACSDAVTRVAGARD